MLEYDIRCIQIIFFSVGLKAKKTKAVLNDEDEEADTPCRKRKKYSDLELSTLDTVFLSSGGTPNKSVMERTANALKIDEQQVSYCRLPFGLLATTWLFASRHHPALIL